MQPLTHGGVALFCCVECKGLWFDGGEVARVIGDAEVGPFRDNLAGPRSRETPLPCPRGHETLREVTLELPADRADVCGCPECIGVWMEPEDLRRIRVHLPRPDVASEERVESLQFRIDDAQRQADDARAALREKELPRMVLFLQAPLAPMEIYSHVRRRPIITYALIAACAVVFALQIAAGGLTELALVPAAFLRGTAPWTIVTAMFLHGDVLHLAGNMYFLAIFGDNVEDRLSRGQYLLLYLLGGLGASLAHIASDPASTDYMLGASGAISAVMGAYAVLFPRRRLYMMLFVVMGRVRAIWYLALWLAMQFYFVFRGEPGVAWWAHIGGVIVGAALALLHRIIVRRRLQAAAAM
jgi:membrane associated rhomboid family serine protease